MVRAEEAAEPDENHGEMEVTEGWRHRARKEPAQGPWAGGYER